MMGLAALFTILCFLCITRGSADKHANEEHRLLIELFDTRNYDKNVMPRESKNDTLIVHFGLALINLLDLDEKNQALVLNTWARMSWNDFRLKWDASSYDDTNLLRIPETMVWKPDIFLYNSATASYTSQEQEVNVVLYSDGTILWIPPKKLTSHCAINMRKFPFDSHDCTLKFGSWTYDGHMLDLSHYEGRAAIDLDDYRFHDEWKVTETTGRKVDKYYPCCKEPYPDITYNITFKRETTYYSRIYVGPAVVMALLIPFVFLMPTGTGEKISLGIGVMICLVLMVQAMESFIPSALSAAPLIAVFYSSSFIMMGISMAFNVLTAGLWWRGHSSRPPGFLTKLLTGCCGKLLCIDPRDDTAGPAAAEDGSKSGKAEDNKHAGREWRLLSVLLDKLLFVLFLAMVIIMTVAILA